MHAKWSYLIVILFIVAAGAYYFLRGNAMPSDENILTQYVEAGELSIESVDFSYTRDGGYLQITALMRGNYPDSCTTLGTYTQRWEDDNFFVQIMGKRPEDALCAQVLTPFEETIMLSPVRGMGGQAFPGAPSSPGAYTIDLNGHQDTLTLHEDDFIE